MAKNGDTSSCWVENLIVYYIDQTRWKTRQMTQILHNDSVLTWVKLILESTYTSAPSLEKIGSSATCIDKRNESLEVKGISISTEDSIQWRELLFKKEKIQFRSSEENTGSSSFQQLTLASLMTSLWMHKPSLNRIKIFW